ncbi:trehalose-6-phosphate synthase [Rhodovastum atsumiense]|uniref:Trehalose-6-phosphate synthase n=1 Tax=Rhodovastum atsumiense TaxID=504468 RepID=A0A5M6J3L2_9PROT|nr:trehalose-6-phosphate synthase [Rhodovastum atsumiense]KAA5614255.1 trehalose-6-phosphate synthase [Rhodovastum atsumiense]CAH2604706.1 trehalose-6-phosphate synthase [Rhodovastum atsumiense]
MSRLVLVSNRVPPPRERSGAAGGLAVALREAVSSHETLWFGWSGTAGAQAATQPRIHRSGRITYATLDLAQGDYEGYYRGFSNGMLWPLLHYQVALAEFRREDLGAYQRVNHAFAAALVPLLRPNDLIWVHDYHLIPMGAALREAGVQARIGFFLHVPFPPAAVWAALPQGDEMARELACYDVLGTQTEEDARHMNEVLQAQGLPPKARSFPIGIDPESFAAAARQAEGGTEVRRLIQSLGGRALILGVDRLDYSKGLPQRFRGFARLLRRFPEHRNRVTFLQVAPVSRGDVAQYRSLRRELDELTGRINGEHAEFDWTPLRYLTQAVRRDVLAGFYRMASVGLVTPLRDGMNLVAKEYVAAQNPEAPGMLVLSRFAGAAEAMEGALVINPHDPDETAEALHAALSAPPEERRTRWRQMWTAVNRHTSADWARGFMAELEGTTARAA